MYDTLIFLHVLTAFFLGAAVVMFSSFVLGGPLDRPNKLVAEILWGVGSVGTLVFGIWLALNRPEYEIWDGWIIAALVLWVLANGAGARASRDLKPTGDGSAITIDRRVAFAHWMRVLWVVLLLLVMVWKPGA
jgi:uncharacterized membrane protein